MESLTKQYSFKAQPKPGRVIRFIMSDESVDRDGDIIEQNGWDVEEYLKNPVIFFGHKSSDPPIGRCVKIESDRRSIPAKTFIDIQFPLVGEMTTEGEEASDHALFCDMIYNSCKNGFLNSVSVGFRIMEGEPITGGGRRIKRAKLYEVSVVSIPANSNALIQGLKELGATEKLLGKIGGEIMVEKGGARLSKASLETLDGIHKGMAMLHEEYTTKMGAFHTQLKDFVFPPDQAVEEEETQEEEPKKFLDLEKLDSSKMI